VPICNNDVLPANAVVDVVPNPGKLVMLPIAVAFVAMPEMSWSPVFVPDDEPEKLFADMSPPALKSPASPPPPKRGSGVRTESSRYYPSNDAKWNMPDES